MNNKLILSLLFLAFTSTAFAADKAGDPCPQTGNTSQVGNEVLSCVDGKWKVTSNVGTAQVLLTVQLMEGEKTLTSATVTTLDGQPAPISVGGERSYIAQVTQEGNKTTTTPGTIKEGFFMMLTPILTKNGLINVEFVVSKSELTAINTFKQGDMEVQLPQVSTINLQQKLALESGKEITIPFGPVINPGKGISPMRSQYTLKLIATKV